MANSEDMPTWEYATHTASLDGEYYWVKVDRTEKTLNGFCGLMGANGWEVVSMVPTRTLLHGKLEALHGGFGGPEPHYDVSNLSETVVSLMITMKRHARGAQQAEAQAASEAGAAIPTSAPAAIALVDSAVPLHAAPRVVVDIAYLQAWNDA